MAKILILYMAGDDENQFLDYVRSLGSLTILPVTSPTSDFPSVGILPEPQQEESTRRFWLCHDVTGMPLVTEYAPKKSHYVVDGYQSPVIEFWRSWTISQLLMAGGIEAEMMWIDNKKQDIEKKPKEFREWFESLDRWIHKNFVQLGIHVFAGPGAITFRDEGGILQDR